eukprot:TRINITY_DN57535_c0_g1_i1.p1 TRINITY_DN57535_c0_g1~~TRINITY_DN57535_c0_g1_i1.p1  ORF type:complete len:173 (-),score=27.25 TRINITY_DN57535_c0_g1_i1:18-515(-)
MPKVRTRKPPAGFELVEGHLAELEQKMREAEHAPHEGKRKNEMLWPIFRINWERSRYVYEMFHRRKAISKELYNWLLEEGYADASLIAKWKKPGYEVLCCTRCIQPRDHNFGTACVCRVPRKKLEDKAAVQCVHCGCKGCASGDPKDHFRLEREQAEQPPQPEDE